MLNTGLRVGGRVALVCSRFSDGDALTASFFEEAKPGRTAHCREHETIHRVRPIFEAFGEGLFAVGGRYSADHVDFSIDVAQLLFLIARAQGERAITFPAERRTA
jgi:hypothetical protein